MTDADLVTREILIHRAGELGIQALYVLRGDYWPHSFGSPDAPAYRLGEIYRLARHAATYALDALGREP